MGQEIRIDMTFQVVNAEKGFAGPQGQSLGKGEPDQQAADEPRSTGHRHQSDLVQTHAGCTQGGIGDIQDSLQVTPGRQFRDNPAKSGVLFNLGEEDITPGLSPVLHHRRTCFVTRCLNP